MRTDIVSTTTTRFVSFATHEGIAGEDTCMLRPARPVRRTADARDERGENGRRRLAIGCGAPRAQLGAAARAAIDLL
jgi:hypothetical protein